MDTRRSRCNHLIIFTSRQGAHGDSIGWTDLPLDHTVREDIGYYFGTRRSDELPELRFHEGERDPSGHRASLDHCGDASRCDHCRNSRRGEWLEIG